MSVALVLAVPVGARAFDLGAALAAAPVHGIVRVPAGVYRGPITIERPVRLIGVPGAVIDGGGRGTVVRILAPDVELRGFAIRDSGRRLWSEDCGVMVSAARVLIADNRLDHVLFGIYLKQAPGSRILGNHVSGYDLPLPVRGDGIRLWYSNGCRIEGNTVTGARDNIIWFSRQDVVTRNRFTADRYGLHLMYDDGLDIRDNWLSGNFVGAFLMYSWHVVFDGNVCLGNRGVSGYGLGIKNINAIQARDNRILDNAVGIWMNSSPSAITAKNLFERNIFAYNDTGLMIDPSDRGNTFDDNVFMDNGRQVDKTSGGPLEGDEFSAGGRGNYWSDYQGYPGADAITGAVPYRVRDLFDSLSDQYPLLQLFRSSPAQEAVDLAAKAFPLIQPEVVLTDRHPLMAPPALHAAPLPAPPSGHLLALSVALLVGMGAIVGVAEIEQRRKGDRGQTRRLAFAACKEASGSCGVAEPAVVAVKGLTKSFGRRLVLRDVSFGVARGRAVAFWGGNGAGKSTTIKCLLGLLRFSGSIRIGEVDVARHGRQARRLLGYVPQELRFYPDWTVRRTLEFFRQVRRLPAVEAERVLSEVGMESNANRKVDELSGGMRQRLGLAAALLGDPEVLLLDEFTSNLDADAREGLIGLLARLRSAGLTILFATHRLDEVHA
ncbi:MAG: nitrous oxide reductase family maturation protein NosD, partial [Opitutaceae bacterium]